MELLECCDEMLIVAKYAFVSLVNVLIKVGKSNVLWCI